MTLNGAQVARFAANEHVYLAEYLWMARRGAAAFIRSA